ncbi:hypothetical protein DSM112329_00495 [Paraconexibacter sp. AEG42_29]|uniref:Uncharacterized protein n=1 Tax=Paraconexibacter sp. AEG42_29 TaxID=2997339 RepID=A0AAU7APW0_9ACTN
MADKQITVAVPEDRVPEFYAWFAAFLAADRGDDVAGLRGPGFGPGARGGGPGFRPGGGRGDGPGGFTRGRGRGGRGMHPDAEPWTGADTEEAAWLLGKLAPPARALFDLLAGAPGERFSGNDIAARLGLDKGAHGVAGILAWPGRYCRKLDRELPILTDGREDGGTDYYMDPEVAALFAPVVPPPAAAD